MSYEDLGPAPDIDNIDIATLDKGDSLPEPQAPAPAAEPEPKAEVTPEAKEEAGETQPRNDKGQFQPKEAAIPKARFDEAVAKEREAREQAERRAADLERQLAQRAQTQSAQAQRSGQIDELETRLSDLEKQHAELLLDGDVEKASSIMKEIRHSERQIARLEAQAESSQVVNMTLEQERLDLAVAKLEAEHPVLNPKSEAYDNDLVQMILLVQREMVNNGQPPSHALYSATERVMGRLARVAEPEVKKEGLSQAEVEDRKVKQIEKALDTQKRQPPSMKDAGLDSDKLGEKGLPNVTAMSAEEYAALPEATRARLRGDLI